MAGHTKNRGDGSFGLVNRELKVHNVVSPAEIMRVFYLSSSTNIVVCSADVRWFNCKNFLQNFYTMPSALKITRYPLFRISKSDPCTVQVKEFITDTVWKRYILLKRYILPQTVL